MKNKLKQLLNEHLESYLTESSGFQEMGPNMQKQFKGVREMPEGDSPLHAWVQVPEVDVHIFIAGDGRGDAQAEVHVQGGQAGRGDIWIKKSPNDDDSAYQYGEDALKALKRSRGFDDVERKLKSMGFRKT